jgi:hypothetical protein
MHKSKTLTLVVMGPRLRGDDVEERRCAHEHRHCEPAGRRKAPPDDRLRETIQCHAEKNWIASSLRSSQ